jgi:hypothetical protein
LIYWPARSFSQKICTADHPFHAVHSRRILPRA